MGSVADAFSSNNDGRESEKKEFWFKLGVGLCFEASRSTLY